MYSCKKVHDCINEYLDGQLCDDEKAQVSLHLESCADCKQEADFMLKITYGLSQIQPVMAPANLRPSIMEAVRKQAEKARRPFFMHYKIYSPVLAAVVLVFLFRVSAIENYVAITEPMVTTPVATQQITQDTPSALNSSSDVSSPNSDTSKSNATTSSQVTKTSNTAGKTVAKTNTKSTNSGVSTSQSSQKPQESVAVNPTPTTPPSNGDTTTDNTSVNSTSVSMTYSAYAPNPDQYDKHVLRIKKSAVSGLAIFRLGTVSYDYFMHMEQSLSSGDYTEEFAPSKTGNPLGDLYLIVVE